MSRKPNNGTGSKAGKKGFYMFSRDLLSSQRYRSCSWVAKGVYCDLLNVLAVQPRPGAISLKDFDLKPHNSRSLTFRCLQCQQKAKDGEYQSIKYFAEAIATGGASGPRPGLIHGLQELYLRGMIVIEKDTMIQPRMYHDNGFRLTDDEGNERQFDDNGYVIAASPDDAPRDAEAELIRLEQRHARKGTKKDGISPTRALGSASRASDQKRVRDRVINNDLNNNDKEECLNNDAGEKNETGNTGENSVVHAGGNSDNGRAEKQKKNAPFSPPTLEEVVAYCAEKHYTFNPEKFWSHYEANGWVQGKGKPIRSWKACCTTWQLREQDGEFRNVQQQLTARFGRSPDAGIPQQVTGENFEGQDTW